MSKLYGLIFSLLISNVLFSQTITIEITNVRSTEGHLLLGFYTNDVDYQSKTAILKKTVLKTNLKDGKVHVDIEGFKPGTYGIALLDDEDWDRKMAYKLFLPNEGYAFSNYHHTEFRKPVFEDFQFELGNEDKKVIMRCTYL